MRVRRKTATLQKLQQRFAKEGNNTYPARKWVFEAMCMVEASAKANAKHSQEVMEGRRLKRGLVAK